MAEVGSAYVSLIPSARGFGSKMQSSVGPQVDGVAKKSGSRFGKIFAYSTMGPLRALGGAALGFFAFNAIKNGISGVLEEAREAQVVTARTENVIKSMGLASKVSAGQIADLAGRISQKTAVDDEAIQSGQNLLLTFKNVAASAGKVGGVFSKASRSVVNMSAALGTDVKGAAIQVGKALNDPIKGVTALARAGVSFSAGQKEQITNWVESGRLAKAQGLILGELKKQFGGAAAAMATPADRLKVTMANLKESIGTRLLPVVDRLIGFIIAGVPRVSAAFNSLGPVLASVVRFLTPLVTTLVSGFKQALPGLVALGQTVIASVLPAVKNLGAALRPIVQEMFAALPGILSTLGSLFGALGGTLVSVTGFLAQHSTAVGGAVVVIGSMIAAWKVYRLVVGIAAAAQVLFNVALSANPVGLVIIAIAGLAAGIVYAYKKSETFRGIVDFLWSGLKRLWSILMDNKQVFLALLGPVGALAAVLITAYKRSETFRNVVQAVIGVVRGMAGAVANSIGDLVRFGAAIVDRVKDAAAFVTGLKNKFGEALDYVKSIPGKVGDALSGLYEAGLHAADELIRGLVAALGAGLQRVKDKVSEIAGAIKGFFPGSPVKTGPLTVWNDGSPGKYLMEMLAKGIESGKFKAVNAALDAAKSLRDTFKTQLDGIKSDFASLSSSIASSFTGNLFDAATGADFLMGASNTSNMLESLKKAFRKLQGWGLSSQFLSQLFASGNSALILDLAGGPRSTAQDSADLFGFSQSLGNQLGNQVARNQYGAQIDRLGQKLDKIEKAIKHVGPDVGRAMDHAAGASARRR